MPCPERLAASRVVLLDAHLGVAKTHDTHFVAYLDIDGRLLWAVRSPERLVERYLSIFICCHLNGGFDRT